VTNGLQVPPLSSVDGSRFLTREAGRSSISTSLTTHYWWELTAQGLNRRAVPVDSNPTKQVFSPNGQRLAAAGARKVSVWDLPSAHALLTLTQAVDEMAFDWEGQRLAIAPRKTLHVYDLGSGQQLWKSPWLHDLEAASIQWSRDGVFLVT